jgi:hypothetical protein
MNTTTVTNVNVAAAPAPPTANLVPPTVNWVARSVTAGAAAAVTTGAKTAYQTLVSVNNMNEEQFKENDRKTCAQYWDKVFQKNAAGEDIFNEIASRGGASTSSLWDSVSI